MSVSCLHQIRHLSFCISNLTLLLFFFFFCLFSFEIFSFLNSNKHTDLYSGFRLFWTPCNILEMSRTKYNIVKFTSNNWCSRFIGTNHTRTDHCVPINRNLLCFHFSRFIFVFLINDWLHLLLSFCRSSLIKDKYLHLFFRVFFIYFFLIHSLTQTRLLHFAPPFF